MKKYLFIFSSFHLFIFLLFAFASCKRFPNPFEGERVVARAGREVLRQMDVERVVPQDISGTDSLAWVVDYVNRWVRDELKLQMADRLFKKEEREDEELLASYRNILKNRRLEQHFVREKVGDSLYTDGDLEEYYASHQRDFVLDRTIVKGRVVAVPKDFRQLKDIRSLFADFSGDRREEAVAMAEKNGFVLREFAEWTEYPQFLVLLPTRRNQSYDELATRGGLQEMEDGGVVYFFVITDARTTGQSAPYELVRDIVRQTVATLRRGEIVRAAEDSLYDNAILEKRAIINL